MKTLWLLTWRGMKKRKAGTLLLGGAVALSAMFLTLVALVGLSSVKTAVENAKDTYGEQMVVATRMRRPKACCTATRFPERARCSCPAA